MIAYFDTSALVKLLVDEPGSEVVARTWRSATAVAASYLAYAEARAALAAATRAGRLTDEAAPAAVLALDEVVAQVVLVPPSRDVVWRAGDLAQAHALRGYDAVHLSSAIEVGRGTTFVTADARLALAAGAEGLGVVVP